jgi:hypothetical protein
MDKPSTARRVTNYIPTGIANKATTASGVVPVHRQVATSPIAAPSIKAVAIHPTIFR